jgi:Na+/melibiose symporter-like transporter
MTLHSILHFMLSCRKWALKLVTLILPGIIALAGCLLIWNYPITQKRHAIIRKWLARRAGGQHQ